MAGISSRHMVIASNAARWAIKPAHVPWLEGKDRLVNSEGEDPGRAAGSLSRGTTMEADIISNNSFNSSPRGNNNNSILRGSNNSLSSTRSVSSRRHNSRGSRY